MSNEIWDGFVAAMLHDVGKLALNRAGQWEKHFDLDSVSERLSKEYGEDIDFRGVLGERIVDIIRPHQEENISLNSSKTQIALALADKIQKAMSQQEKLNEFSKLVNNPWFYPYYGYPNQWKPESALIELRRVIHTLQKAKKAFTAKDLLSVNRNFMLRYPGTSYLPHISLAMHHQLTGVLFLFIFDKLSTLRMPSEVKSVSFSLIEVIPDPLDFFYRLRDIIGYSNVVRKLEESIYRHLFAKKYGTTLKGIGPFANPFSFYHGNSFIFLCESGEDAIEALNQSINQISGLRSIRVNTHNYFLALDWKKNVNSSYSVYSPPEKTEVFPKTFTLVARDVFDYRADATQLCSACGKPEVEFKEDDKGNRLCCSCFNLRTLSSGVDIDQVSIDEQGNRQRVGYVFITLPDDLLSEVKSASEKLLRRFENKTHLPTSCIHTSEIGLLEYLQALMELREFQSEISKELSEINKTYKPLFELPTFSGYVLREDLLWRFLGYIKEETFNLTLSTSTKSVVCGCKEPFWSLVEELSKYSEGDFFYDIYGGGETMFSDSEVQKIRELAAEAVKFRVFPTQLNRLAEVALNTSKEELLLEIDTSADRLRGFEDKLKEGISELTKDKRKSNLENREKRSVFIKYIAKLSSLEKQPRRRW